MGVQKSLALLVGAVLTLTGVVGFFMGDLLLLFGINTLHNIVHLATGALGLVAGLVADGEYAVQYNRWLGVVYLLVTVLGFLGLLGFLNVNMPDNFLHLALGLVLVGVGFGVHE